MEVSLHQVARRYLQSAHPNFAAEIENVCVSMRDRHVGGKHLKSAGPDLREISHGSVGHQRHASHRLQDLRMYRPYECSQSRPLVKVFDHHDARLWNREDLVPPVRPVIVKVTMSFHGRVRAPDARRGRVTHHRWKFLKDATNS